MEAKPSDIDKGRLLASELKGAVLSHSVVFDSAIPWTVALQATAER